MCLCSLTFSHIMLPGSALSHIQYLAQHVLLTKLKPNVFIENKESHYPSRLSPQEIIIWKLLMSWKMYYSKVSDVYISMHGNICTTHILPCEIWSYSQQSTLGKYVNDNACTVSLFLLVFQYICFNYPLYFMRLIPFDMVLWSLLGSLKSNLQ